MPIAPLNYLRQKSHHRQQTQIVEFLSGVVRARLSQTLNTNEQKWRPGTRRRRVPGLHFCSKQYGPRTTRSRCNPLRIGIQGGSSEDLLHEKEQELFHETASHQFCLWQKSVRRRNKISEGTVVPIDSSEMSLQQSRALHQAYGAGR